MRLFLLSYSLTHSFQLFLSLLVRRLSDGIQMVAAFLADWLKIWLLVLFFMLKKTRLGAHLKNLGKCPKMLYFKKISSKKSGKRVYILNCWGDHHQILGDINWTYSECTVQISCKSLHMGPRYSPLKILSFF